MVFNNRLGSKQSLCSVWRGPLKSPATDFRAFDHELVHFPQWNFWVIDNVHHHNLARGILDCEGVGLESVPPVRVVWLHVHGVFIAAVVEPDQLEWLIYVAGD